MKNQFWTKCILVALYIFISIPFAFCQSEQENLEKYWNYREKFKKYFVIIGAEDGEGINVSNIDNMPINAEGGFPNTPVQFGYHRWGDAMALQGPYIAVLATEYRLLKDGGQDTRAILNELYYAINAVNRVDFNAEPYFDPAQGKNLNGFIIRDDVDKNFSQKWTSQFPSTSDPRDQYDGIKSDYYTDNNPATGQTGNEQSQDQLIGLMMGFIHVIKLVDNVYVKPKFTDGGIYLHDEVKAIVSRMMGRIVQSYFLDDNNDSHELNEGFCDVTANWIVVNPVTNKKVGTQTNRTEVRPFSYGLAKAAEAITGNSYMGHSILHKAEDELFDGHFCFFPHDVTVPLNTVKNLFWDNLENLNIQPEQSVLIPALTNLFNWHGLPDILNWTNPSVPDYNISMILELATTGGTWSHANITRLADNYEMWIYDLVYAVLYNETPIHSKVFYENILNTAPCNGPYNFNPGGPNAVPAAQQNPALYSGEWNENSRWNHPFGPSGFTRGEYNGNDYMWLYNLYQLAFKNSPTMPNYKDVSCPCESSPKLKMNMNGAVLNNSTTLYRKFSNYLDINIKIKEFLIDNLTILNNKKLRVKTDLVVCDNKRLLVVNGGELIVGDATGVESSLIIRSGSVLRLGNNSTLRVYDNSKVIIEDGAKLLYQQGVTIELLGDNAVLEIQGDLELNNNSVFTFTYPGTKSGYIKFSKPGSSQFSYNQITALSGSSIELTGQNKQDKILEVSQDFLYLMANQNINLFKIRSGTVEFANPKGLGCLSADVPVRLVNSQFVSSTTGGKLLVWGQKICQIVYSIFDGVSIEGNLSVYGNPLNIFYTEILHGGLYTIGVGVNLNGVNCHDNYIGWEANSLTLNSRISNSRFNNNGFAGVSLIDSPVEVSFLSSELNDNLYGIDVLGASSIKVRCGSVKNNQIGFSLFHNAALNMSTLRDGGYVDARNNAQGTIHLYDANSVDLNEGYNDLRVSNDDADYNDRPCYQFGNCPVAISGTLNQANNNPILANNNKWQPNNLYPLTCCGSNSIDKFTYVTSSLVGGLISFTDNAQNDQVACGFWDAPPCPGCPITRTPKEKDNIGPAFSINYLRSGLVENSTSNIKLYPNPVADVLNLKIDNIKTNSIELRIIDMLGQTILLETLAPDKQEYTFSMAVLSAGVYFVQIVENGIPIRIEKVVKY